MAMPNMNELSQVYGNWNPEAYLQGRNQVDLATQYQHGANQGQVLDNRSKDLSNIFNEQANPLRVQGLGLDNSGKQLTQEGQGYDNRVKSVNANLAEGTAQFKLNQAQRDELKNMKESDIVMGELQAREMMMHPDPAIRAQGEQLDSFTKFARDARRAQENKMEETRYKEDAANKRSQGNNATTLEAARIGAEGRLAVKNAGGSTPTDFWSSYNKMKTARDKHSSLVAQAARVGPESPEYQILVNMAEAIRPQAEAEISAVKPGSVDMGAATGLPTQGGPSIAPKTGGKAQHSLSDVQKMYPGVPADKLKQVYKQKFGVDLQ